MGLTRRRFAGLWVPVLFGLGGCTGRGRDAAAEEGVGSPTANRTTAEPTGRIASPTPQPTATSHPALSSELVELLTAEDPVEYARSRGLRVEGSAVLVTVELSSAEADLPSEHVRSVERRQGAFVRAYVPFDSLVPLASEDAVGFVRPPLSGSPTTATEGES